MADPDQRKRGEFGFRWWLRWIDFRGFLYRLRHLTWFRPPELPEFSKSDEFSFEMVWIHAPHPSYKMTQVSSDSGAALLKMFTKGIEPISRVRSWNPLRKSISYGESKAILVFYGHPTTSISVADRPTVIIEGWYYRIDERSWDQGHALLSELMDEGEQSAAPNL